MSYSHEGASDKIKDIKREFAWSEEKARRFHDWLGKNYSSSKDSMSYTKLREVAQEFNREDSGR